MHGEYWIEAEIGGLTNGWGADTLVLCLEGRARGPEGLRMWLAGRTNGSCGSRLWCEGERAEALLGFWPEQMLVPIAEKTEVEPAFVCLCF